jgi:hypothetical protein
MFKFIEIDRANGISVPAERINMIRDVSENLNGARSLVLVGEAQYFVDRSRADIIAELRSASWVKEGA